MLKVHQNIILDGQDMGDGAVRKDSKFCNEGKWNNFIEPILPIGDIFVEYGSNAGLFLRLAKEQEYETVIGLERDKNACEVAKKYRDEHKLDYRIIQTQIDKDTDIPLADVTLLANFHYHQHIADFLQLLDKLETKTCYCLIVSVNEAVPVWRAQAYQRDVKRYFSGWRLAGLINPIDPTGDPHPRQMFSYLYQSQKLGRVSLNNLEFRKGEHYDAMAEFAEMIIENPKTEVKKTKYYKLKKLGRQNKWSQKRLDEFVQGKRDLILDIQKNGTKEPIILDRNFVIADGLHRYFAVKALGHNSIIARI